MWKPSQSGNPAGVGKAYLEAMREGSTPTQCLLVQNPRDDGVAENNSVGLSSPSTCRLIWPTSWFVSGARRGWARRQRGGPLSCG